MSNTSLQDYLLVQSKRVKNLSKEREHKFDNVENKRGSDRNELSRDYSRVVYSNAFRRQQGKMQLFPVNNNNFHRNRLTHSYEVAQIARGIVETLEQQITDETVSQQIDFKSMSIVVETGSLVHDIGNPPFGHHGERILDKLSGKLSFEGNAQGLRVLRILEKKSPGYKGLNLTLRTLASIIKYNVMKSDRHKKFIYEEDYKEINNLVEKHAKSKVLRTIDVQIVDLADEIAYCAHDLEDALAKNYFTIDEFLFLLGNREDNCENFKKNKTYIEFKEWVEEAKKRANKAESGDDYDFYFRRELISKIVNTLINDISVVEVSKKSKDETGTDNSEELGFGDYALLATNLKKTIFEGVTNSSDVILYENVGTTVLTDLFHLFMDEDYNRNGMLLPVEYRWTKDADKIRSVLDYISGMMDTYAIELYEKHFGVNPFEVKYTSQGKLS